MKTIQCLVGALLFYSANNLSAQSNLRTLDLPLERLYEKGEQALASTPNTSAESIIWSEDFANGIPASWLNEDTVYTNIAVWAYHGTGSGAVQPADSGSQGFYAGNSGPIQSTSRSNGFIIYDSDYYANLGYYPPFGNPYWNPPHYATLTTDTIDLTNETEVDLVFSQYYRRFRGPGGSQQFTATYVDLSTDGGQTFPHSIMLNQHVPVNQTTPPNARERINISHIVANQSMVKLRFRFDGEYYFWMIDDIQLARTPKYRVEFLENLGFKELDMIHTNGSKLGIFTECQERDIYWTCSARNTGSQPLYNAQLRIELEVNQGSTPNFMTFTSPVFTGMWSNTPGSDVLDEQVLNTQQDLFTPLFQGRSGYRYKVVYHLVADSSTQGGQVVNLFSDTLQFYTNDSLISLDANRRDNAVGTERLGDDGSALAVSIHPVNDMYIKDFWIGLGPNTFPGGLIKVEVHDTASFNPPLGVSGSPLISVQKNITALDTASGFIRVNADSNSYPLHLAAMGSPYHILVYMYSSGGQFPIEILNDQQWEQGSTSLMLWPGSGFGWFSGFSASRLLNSPWIRLIDASDPYYGCNFISLEEDQERGISVYPNPTSEKIHIWSDVAQGEIVYSLYSTTGQLVMQGTGEWEGNLFTLEAIQTPSGVYILHVVSDGIKYFHRVLIE